MASGGKAINIGELAIAIALKTGALEAGLKDVQKQLKDHGKKVQATGADYDKLAIVAGVAFWKITSAISSGVKAFNDFNNSMVGLKSVVQGTGNDFSKAQGFVDSFTKDGLVPASDAATGLKNLLSHKMGFEQAVDVMNRFKDSAAFARQGSLTLGEAIRGGTEGLKNSLSMMVDNTGVTENLSVMWDKYAKTIGKTGATLSESEKVQAEYVGVMRATAFQVGDAAKYSEQFAGAQARNTAETLKLKQAFGESLVPALSMFLGVLTPVISLLTTLTKNNPELVAALTLTITGFLGIITVVTAVGAAVKLVTPALAALKISLTGLMVNPVVLALTALAVVGGTVAAQVMKAKKAQEGYNNALNEYNKIAKDGITKSEIPSLQEKIDKLKELQKQYDDTIKKYKEAEEFSTSFLGTIQDMFSFGILPTSSKDVFKYREEIEGITASMKAYGATQETINKVIADYEVAVKNANRTTALEYTDQAKAIAIKKVAVTETQNLINAYKSAKTGTKDWFDAQQKLAEQFPQFSTASGIEIKAIEDITTAQDTAVKAEWSMMKAKIAMTKIDLQNIISVKVATLESLQAQQDMSDSINEVLTGKKVIRPPWDNSVVSKARTELASLKEEIKTLDAFDGLDINKVLGIKPIVGEPYKTYENAALDSALKIHNHKVAMSELSKEAELADLQKISKAYAKTADERMGLEEQIFQVKQAIRDKDLAATQKAIDDEAKKLVDRTSNSENWIDRQKTSGNLTGQEEIDAYNRIIKYHKEYLAKIKADQKISADDKKKIIADETKTIQDQQNKIFDIQKATVEKAVNAYIDAKKKQYSTEEELEDKRLNDKLKALDKEYSNKENTLKIAERNNDLSSLYDEERKYQNAATKEGQDKLKDIRDKISSLNKEATKDALDAEKESRKSAIEQELSDNKDKYKKLNDDLTTQGSVMIASSASYAKQANDEIIKGQNTIANSLKGIMTNFDKETSTLITTGMNNLRNLIQGYKTIMDGIKLSPNVKLATSGAVGAGLGVMAGNKQVIINDYGNKILSGIEDIQDYSKELVTGADNASRG